MEETKCFEAHVFVGITVDEISECWEPTQEINIFKKLKI